VIYQFGDCSLDCQRQELVRAGAPVAVEPQVFRLIVHLIENRDRVVSKDELFEAIWKGRIVSDGTLNTRMATARAALGDDGTAQSVIKTFSRRGFRFVADVTETGASSAESSPALKPPPDKPSVAVMPFNNLSGDPEQEYFADGIAEDLITGLSRIRHLLVTARNTTFAYKGQALDVQAVASEIGVRYVLEGSVRKSGNRVRITVQLIDGETGNHLWAERYDRDFEDIFAVQDDITQTVVGALQPELAGSEIERARRKPPESLDAWDLYQRGLWHENRITRADNATAIELFSKAIALDQEFARPYAGLSECYTYDVFYGYAKRDPSDIFTPARKAVEIDPKDGNAHRALGWAYTFHREHSSAIAELKIAIGLNPNEAHSYAFLGFAQAYSGLVEEALASFRSAINLSPQHPFFGWFHAGMALALLLSQRH
jgi:TolB-like protein